MKEVTIDRVRARIAHIESLNARGVGTKVEQQQFELACLRDLLELLALRERVEPVAWTDEQELRDVNERGCGYLFTVNPITPHADPRRVIKLYAEPPAPVVPDDYFASLVTAARARAEKAMRNFPQPNYVLNKVAEEGGEVIKAVIHYTEGRETWQNVETEIIDNLAMLIRLVAEGDGVIGFTPPDACRAAMLAAAGVPAPGKEW